MYTLNVWFHKISMIHNSIIIFSTKTNKHHKHKIILDNMSDDSEWMGVTFRLSKTFVSFDDKGIQHLANGSILRGVTDGESSYFMISKTKKTRQLISCIQKLISQLVRVI